MTFLYNAWYAAGFPETIGREPVMRRILDQPVLLYRTEGGEAVALSDICAHRFAPLHKGVLHGDIIQCPYHGLRFGPDGACVFNPHGDGPISRSLKVRRYPLVERDQISWIWMGEGEGNLSLLPSYPRAGKRDDMAVVHGYLRVEANYRLVSDNLLDLSHAQYLHPYLASGGGGGNSAQSEASEEDGRVVMRTFKLSANTPHFRALWEGDPPEEIEMRTETVIDFPSNLRLDIKVNVPGEEPGSGVFTSGAHLLTPETESSTHYFWASARSTHIHDEAVSKRTLERVLGAFVNEDAPMIEAQQRYREPARAMGMKQHMLKSDAALVRAEWLLNQRLAQEAAGSSAVQGGTRA